MKKYTVGTTEQSWRADQSQTITFVVTEDCNLRCKYCYITHKSSDKKMNVDVAKKFIDYILTSEELAFSEAAIIEFIGGEPFIEVDLIDEIADYFKVKAFELDHRWAWNYRISICTNGVNYSSEKVQNFIHKNVNKISVGMTVDGTKEKHDLQRVFPDGSGSFDTINKNIDLWISQFGGNTKVTFASDDLPMLKDSIIYLWNRGIKHVSANVVFEDVWKENDDKVFEDQLIQLADYIIDNNLYNDDYICSLFTDYIGQPYNDEDLDKTFCGAGKMIALSPDGRVFPCIRYYGYSLNNHEEWPLGDVEHGIDMEMVRPFMLASNRIQSDEKCLKCPIASGCAFCQGFNYDEAETPTNFSRATYICDMHKARVRANDYYFSRLYNEFGVERELTPSGKRSLYVLLSDDYTSFCDYKNSVEASSIDMDKKTVLESLEYARNSFFRPFFVHSNDKFEFEYIDEFNKYMITHIVPAKFIDNAKKAGLKSIVPVYDKDSIAMNNYGIQNVIFNIDAKDISNLSDCVTQLFEKVSRIDINIQNIDKAFDENAYQEQLDEISQKIVEYYDEQSVIKELSILTDVMFIKKHDNCMAGENTFVISPEGNLYTCCGVYSSNPKEKIGNTVDGVTEKYSAKLYEIENSNLCRNCDCYQCKDCVNMNRNYTREVNVSPSFLCRKSHIEKNCSIELLKRLKSVNEQYIKGITNKINESSTLDPINKFVDMEKDHVGYYKCRA